MNKSIRISLFFLLPCVLLACQPRSEIGVTESDQCGPYVSAKTPCHVALAAVIATPERFLSTDIQVFGFLASGAAPLSIYISREAWASGDTASAIKIESANSIVEGKLRSADPAFVAVSGRLAVGKRPGTRQPFLTLTATDATKLFEPQNLSDRERRLRYSDNQQ